MLCYRLDSDQGALLHVTTLYNPMFPVCLHYLSIKAERKMAKNVHYAISVTGLMIQCRLQVTVTIFLSTNQFYNS